MLPLTSPTCKIAQRGFEPRQREPQKFLGNLYYLYNMRKKTSPIWTTPKEVLEDIVNSSDTLAEVLKRMGVTGKGRNYKSIHQRCNSENIDISRFKENYGKGRLRPHKELSELLVENSTSSRGNVKRRLIREGVLSEKCVKCGLGTSWKGEPLVLVLDHINGVDNDNRLENLRLLCPNCNSQTMTFAGRQRRVEFNESGEFKLRPLKEQKSACPHCSKVICNTSKQCNECRGKSLRKVPDRPSLDNLRHEIEVLGFSAVGRKYGVSDNSIRKWLR